MSLDALRARRGDLANPALALLAALAARLVLPGQLLLAAFTLFTAALLTRHLLTSKRTTRA
jgi:hypothetical protein